MPVSSNMIHYSVEGKMQVKMCQPGGDVPDLSNHVVNGCQINNQELSNKGLKTRNYEDNTDAINNSNERENRVKAQIKMSVITPPSKTFILCLRFTWISAFVLGWYYVDTLQGGVNSLWGYLLTSAFFRCVYFETFWVTICYAILLAIPFLMDKISYFEQYKIDKTLKWQSAGIKKICIEALYYCIPLMLLDTFTTKKYPDVDKWEVTIRRANFIQYDRALPVNSPTVQQIVFQLLMSFIIYDLIFFVIHYTFHRSLWLYKHVHAHHHEHQVLYSRVTNKLSITERILLVLSANQALKMVGSHPLTRGIFVPLFVWWLIENHMGYDLPCTLDKVIPFGLIGGSVKHYSHHKFGSRNYQPFLTYCDKLISSNIRISSK